METILIVEDEPLIAWSVEDDLTDAGYEVLVAHSGDEAMRLLESRGDVSTVFTDVDMPGTLNGLTLAACVSRRWPPMKIIITSGKDRPYLDEMPRGCQFLSKPYLMTQVRRAIAEANADAR